MKKLMALCLSLVLILTEASCALQGTNLPETPPQPGIAEPEPQPPAVEPEPETPSAPAEQPLPEPVFSAVDQTVVDQLGGNTVTVTIPTVELPNSAAAEIINQYFSLLSGKVRDYAEGDLTSVPGVICTVTAEYALTRISDTVLSFLWTVDTVTNSPELPGSTTVSAVTFDPGTGRILTFRDLFGGQSGAVRGQFITCAKAVIAQQEANHYYFDGWKELLSTTFDEACFFVKDEGVCVFYPRDAIGTHTEVLLSWDELAGSLAIKP